MARGGAGQYNVARIFAKHDEGMLGKRDDDHGKSPSPAGGPGKNARINWSLWKGKVLRPRNRRKWLILCTFAFAIWYLIWGVPSEWWEPSQVGLERQAANRRGGQVRDSGNVRSYPPKRPISSSSGSDEQPLPPPRQKAKDSGATSLQYYDGDVTFPRLSATLRDAQLLLGFRRVHQNILFAASSPKSLGNLLPLACDMAGRGKVSVHIAILGRSDLAYEEILQLNGIDKEECRAYWHDARPNWAMYSSEPRAEASVASAFKHFQEVIRPQTLIMDDSITENEWFVRQARLKAEAHDWSIIELPKDADERLHWISRLDIGGLKAFHKTTIDILVQAPNVGAGGLMKLMKSLAEADYTGVAPPRLTIELPADIDPMVSWYVKGFKWPPKSSVLQPVLQSTLNIRHRIPGQVVQPEEAAVRFMESYFPTHDNSHVLVLNPDVELSPSFYHWLKYYVLYHKSSRTGLASSGELLGLSLTIPKTYLDGKTDFKAPGGPSGNDLARFNPVHEETKAPFAWQAPASDAALYFGDKWEEIHDFLKYRIRKARDGKTSQKIIGEHMPAWTEYILELMRVRGWYIVYPASGRHVEAMATVHEELYGPPEEFAEAFEAAKLVAQFDGDERGSERHEISVGGDELLVGRSPYAKPRKASERPASTTNQPLHSLLAFQDEEPTGPAILHLSYDGRNLGNEQLHLLYEDSAKLFRREIGDCEVREGRTRKVIAGQAGDLFCWGNEKESSWIETYLPDSRNEAVF